MDAKCREDVFEELRKRGIKAIKVIAADGSKANGEIRGVKKRVVAAIVAFVAVSVGVLAYLGGTHSGASTAADPATTSPRHQIYGDPAVMARLERGDFDQVLCRDGDCLLAWFAEPGRLMCPKGIDPRSLDKQRMNAFADYIANELPVEKDLQILSEEPREIRELKQIVNGMREELRDYLANGNGTPRSFWRRLAERTMHEIEIYERTKRELQNVKDTSAWEEKNRLLRRIGLRTISNEE